MAGGCGIALKHQIGFDLRCFALLCFALACFASSVLLLLRIALLCIALLCSGFASKVPDRCGVPDISRAASQRHSQFHF